MSLWKWRAVENVENQTQVPTFPTALGNRRRRDSHIPTGTAAARPSQKRKTQARALSGASQKPLPAGALAGYKKV